MASAVIYGLFDPRKPLDEENARYIGQTVQALGKHLSDHIKRAKAGGTSRCEHWIREVLSDGAYPVIHCLEIIDDDLLATDAECEWITRGFAEGWQLTNDGTGRVPIPWDSSPYLTPQKIEAFWAKVNVLSDDECWEWLAYTNDDGYGMFGVGSRIDNSRRRLYVHRLSWELANGPIPNRLIVCHTCDNPPCVNPSHLFLDSFGGNMKDASAKGRVRNQFSDLEEVTHCPRGHPYSLTSKGKKYCKECNRLLVAAARQKEREAAGLPPIIPYAERAECGRGHPRCQENDYWCNGRRWCLLCKRETDRINAAKYRENKRLSETAQQDLQ